MRRIAVINYKGGTAGNARIDDSLGKVFGKTGTTQVCSNCDDKPHAWFSGFVEYGNNQKLSICILIENGGKGSNTPADMSKKIFEYILKDV